MKKDLITIATYCDSEEKKNYLIDTIQQIKIKHPYFDILIHAHYPLDIEIQKMVNYYIFDKSNPLSGNFFIHWLNVHDYKKVYCILKDYGFANLQQLVRSLGFSKSLGYETMYWTNYDIDIEKTNIFEFLYNLKNKNIFLNSSSEEKKVSLIASKINTDQYEFYNENIKLENYKATSGISPEKLITDIIYQNVENTLILSYEKISSKYNFFSWDYSVKNAKLKNYFGNLIFANDKDLDKNGLLIWDLKVENFNLQLNVNGETFFINEKNSVSTNKFCLYFVFEKEINYLKIEKINGDDVDFEVFNLEKNSKVRIFEISIN